MEPSQEIFIARFCFAGYGVDRVAPDRVLRLLIADWKKRPITWPEGYLVAQVELPSTPLQISNITHGEMLEVATEKSPSEDSKPNAHPEQSFNA